MIDIYIDDVRVKTIGLSDGKHNLILEAKSDKENKAQILFDDEELKTLYILSKNRCEVQGLIPVYNTISGTADVAEVRHGEWLNKLIADNGVAEMKSVCSLCNKPNKKYQPPYCPHCGAKMDGRNNG